MRKHFAPKPVITPTLTLSVEEEAILVDEQNEILTNIKQDDDAVDRLLDTSQVLDDAASAVTKIEEITPTEQQLVDAVAEMAVAGTDAEPTDVIGLEKDGISAESFAHNIAEKLKKMWEQIKALMLKVWAQIMNFFAGQHKALESAVGAQEKNDKFAEENKAFILLLGYDQVIQQEESRPEDHEPMGEAAPLLHLIYSPKKAHQSSKPAVPEGGSDDTIALGHKKDPAKRLGMRSSLQLSHDTSQDADAKAAAAKDAQDSNTQQSDTDGANQAAAMRAKHEQVVQELHRVIPNHKFKLRGDISLVSTMSGIPKDFEKEVQKLLTYSEHTHKETAKLLRDTCFHFDAALAKMESGHPEQGITPFCDKFQKNFEVLMRTIGDAKDHDGLLQGRTKELLLGNFVVEATSHAKGTADSMANQVKHLARATFDVSMGGSKNADAILVSGTTEQTLGIAIKRWLAFATGNDVTNIESTLKEYAEKFIKHIDRLVDIQKSVKSESGDSYHVLQAMIDMCRCLNKVLIAFTTKHIRNTLTIVRGVQNYQKESNAERLRLYQEALKKVA